MVPFVPITETLPEHHQLPQYDFMHQLYQKVGELLRAGGMYSTDVKAGCAKYNACSALSTFEVSTKNETQPQVPL